MAEDVILTKKEEASSASSITKLVNDAVEEGKKAAAASVSEFEQHVEGMLVPSRGDEMTGKMLEATKNAVYIDLGSYGVGVVRGRELWDALEDFTKMEVGSEITATVLESDNEDGMIEMSFRKASKAQVWEDLKKKMESGDNITVKIRSANKGGLMTVVQGINAFLPVSQLTPEHYPRVEGGDSGAILDRLQDFIGSKMEVRVITSEPEENKLIISEKEVEFAKQRELLSEVPIGTKVKGKVSGIVDFGVFVKFPLPGNADQEVEGLVHLSELSWKRIQDPEEIVKQNDEIEVEIIGVDDTKISLSYKRLQEDPWKESVKRYAIGQVVEGVITKVAPFGAFVKLDDEIHGLLHISEIVSEDGERVTNAHNHVREGDNGKYKIISIDAEEHRLGLSQKAMQPGNQTEEEVLAEVSEEDLSAKEEEMKKARLEKFAAARAAAEGDDKAEDTKKKAPAEEEQESEDKE